MSAKHAAQAGSRNKIPVLVVPPALHFSTTAEGSKQVLTLYNITEELSFEILCTSPELFHVEPAKGTLASRSSANVVVRLNLSQLSPSLPDSASSAYFSPSSLSPDNSTLLSRSSSLERPAPRTNKSGRIVTFAKTSRPAVAPAGLTRTGKFRVEVADASSSVYGKHVIPFTIVCETVPTGPGRPALTSTEVLHSTNKAQSTQATASGGTRSAPRDAPGLSTLTPLFVGATLILFFASGDTGLDTISTLWLAFFIGMITMFIQLKYLDAA
eukprot:g42079.t1